MSLWHTLQIPEALGQPASPGTHGGGVFLRFLWLRCRSGILILFAIFPAGTEQSAAAVSAPCETRVQPPLRADAYNRPSKAGQARAAVCFVLGSWLHLGVTPSRAGGTIRGVLGLQPGLAVCMACAQPARGHLLGVATNPARGSGSGEDGAYLSDSFQGSLWPSAGPRLELPLWPLGTLTPSTLFSPAGQETGISQRLAELAPP